MRPHETVSVFGYSRNGEERLSAVHSGAQYVMKYQRSRDVGVT